MFSRHALMKSTGRTVMAAAVAALTVSTFAPTGAMAAPAAKSEAASHGTSGATEFSSARRRHYRGNGNAAALAAFGAIAGTIGSIAAAQSRRDYYDSYGYYDGGPAYGGPAYYGGGPAYYGGGYYGGPYRGYGGGHGYDNSRRMTW